MFYELLMKRCIVVVIFIL